MSNGGTTNGRTPIVFDGWRSISISLYMALVGYSVMVTVPVLSTALVKMAGFSEEQVGRVWGADLGGLSIGAILAAMCVARVNRRWLVMAGVGLTIAANALCIFFVAATIRVACASRPTAALDSTRGHHLIADTMRIDSS